MLTLIRAAIARLGRPRQPEPHPETQDDFHAAMPRWEKMLKEQPK